MTTIDLSTPMPEKELIHHGVKGMKWGVRRDRKVLRAQRKADLKTSRAIANKNHSDRNKLYKMSDADIKKRTDRMNLEINYHNASEKQKQLYRSKGSKALSKIMGSKKGRKMVGKTANKAVKSKAVQTALTKAALMAI